jgi:voltage-gated potassium channel
MDETPSQRLSATEIDRRLRVPILIAAALVIPDLVLEQQPLAADWHTVAVIGDWAVWLVFVLEFALVMTLAHDRRAWLARYPLAPLVIVLTPPFAPAVVQGLRAFRLLRLVRVGRGLELISGHLTLEGIRYVAAVAVFLIVGGGAVFSGVESRVGHHVSTWDGIWWAVGTASTSGSDVPITTNAGRAIAIVLMVVGIGLFSMLTGALASHFVSLGGGERRLTAGEEAIIERLEEVSRRLAALEGDD